MSYKVELSEHFKKEAKKLIKKYKSLKTELANLFTELEKKPTLGNEIIPNIYKIRLAVSSKGKGKSGGARIITYVKIDEQTILLLSIYSKGNKNNISQKEIIEILKNEDVL